MASSERLAQALVDLHHVHVGDALGEVLGEHAEAAADLEHDVAGVELGGAADHAEDVRVDQEVLAEVAIGPHAEAAHAPQARLRRGVRHGAHAQPNTRAAFSLHLRGQRFRARAPALGEERGGVHDVGRLVALPADGLRRQVGGVGLDEQPLAGHLRARTRRAPPRSGR